MSYTLRQMCSPDIPAIERVQELAYGAHFLESAEIIAARYASGVQIAWVAQMQGEVVAYLVAYHSKVGKVSPLHAPFPKITGADCFYLHDLALAPSARGEGVGAALINNAIDYAKAQNFKALSLLSVQNSRPYWEKFGFVEYADLDVQNRCNLETYLAQSDDAHYMVCSLL